MRTCLTDCGFFVFFFLSQLCSVLAESDMWDNYAKACMQNVHTRKPRVP